MYLSVVIPAYNEAARIDSTLRAVCAWLAVQPYDWEVIVVNNRSTDATEEIVRGIMQQFRAIRLIHENRPGKGYAVTAGMRFATGEMRLFMDADNSTPIEYFDSMKPLLDEGTQIVIASLAAHGSRVTEDGQEPMWRRVMGTLGNLWIQVWAVPGIWDTQRGFKAFTAHAANEIFTRLTVFGWGFDIEVLTIARVRGLTIAEIPIVWNNPPDTRVDVWAYPGVLLDTMKIGIHRMAGHYVT